MRRGSKAFLALVLTLACVSLMFLLVAFWDRVPFPPRLETNRPKEPAKAPIPKPRNDAEQIFAAPHLVITSIVDVTEPMICWVLVPIVRYDVQSQLWLWDWGYVPVTRTATHAVTVYWLPQRHCWAFIDSSGRLRLIVTQ